MALKIAVCNRNAWISESHFKLSKRKWKISCLMHEDFDPVDPKSDGVEHCLPEKLVKKLEVDSSSDVKRYWISTVREINTLGQAALILRNQLKKKQLIIAWLLFPRLLSFILHKEQTVVGQRLWSQ